MIASMIATLMLVATLIEGGPVVLTVTALGQPAKGAVVEWVEGPCIDEPDFVTTTGVDGVTSAYVGRKDRFCLNVKWASGTGEVYTSQLHVSEPDEYSIEIVAEYVLFMPIAGR